MIMNGNCAEVLTSGVTGTEQFKFSNSPIIFKILSDSLYSDKITSIVRELASNARDAHIAAGKGDVPFEIHLPVSNNLFNKADANVFSVKDYGTGLSEEEIYNLYTIYGESNKRSSNDFIGGFGIGSKSPFAYTESFTIVSRYNGVKTTYSAFINSDGFPSITKVFSCETDEENGIEVSFPTKEGDNRNFISAVKNELSFFSPFPKVNVNCNITPKEKVLEGKDWFITSERNWSYYNGHVIALIGEIPYEIKTSNLDDYPYITSSYGTTYIKFPVGSLDLSASRESIAYTERTKNAIVERINEVKKEVLANIVENIEDKSLYEKMCFVNSLPLNVEKYARFPHYEDVKKYNTILNFDVETMNNKLEERKCAILWFSNNKRRKVSGRNITITPSKNYTFIYVPKKNVTVESITKYMKKERIENAVVVRYNERSDISFFNNIFGNPSFIEDPEVEVVKRERQENSYVSYRSLYMTSISPYRLVAQAESDKEVPAMLAQKIKRSKFCLLTRGFDFIGGDDWTVEECRTFLSAIHRLHNRATHSILCKFGEIILLPESSYKRMKKEGIVLTSYKECMNYIANFIKENLEFSEYEYEAKKFSCNVERAVSLIIHNFSKEEIETYAKKNILFALTNKLFPIFCSGERMKLFCDYAHSLLDKDVENEYDTYINNEPILKLAVDCVYNSNVRECLVRYLNLN